MRRDSIAYTDEARNTGINLFDADQPFFWTGTLLTSVEVTQPAKVLVEKWCHHFGFDELHGSALGLHRIEQMAGDLGSLIRTHDLRFVFTRLEKTHLATTKFVDTVFDSGINKAVSPLQCISRLLHLSVTRDVAELMDLRDKENYWRAFKEGDCGRFCTVVERLEEAAREQVLDPRRKEILIDAFDWARRHPKRLLCNTATTLDSPNSVSIALLVHALQQDAEDTGHQLARLIHDDTSEFGSAIKATFGSLRGLKPPPSLPSALFSDCVQTDTLRCPIEMRSSKLTPGLQIVDVVLWIVKRYIDVGFKPSRTCQELVGLILERSRIAGFSQSELQREETELCMDLLVTPVADSALERGSEMVATMEEQRRKRMASSIAGTYKEASQNPRHNAKEMEKVVRNLASRADAQID